MHIDRPEIEDQSIYYNIYLEKAEGEDLINMLMEQLNVLTAFILNISDSKGDHRYAADKWSVKQVLQHICDTERIFCYRALSISRGEKDPMPGFDHNHYAANDGSDQLNMVQIMDELISVRKSSIEFFKKISTEQLDIQGICNDLPYTPRILGYVMVGHAAHHMEILRDKYLIRKSSIN